MALAYQRTGDLQKAVQQIITNLGATTGAAAIGSAGGTIQGDLSAAQYSNSIINGAFQINQRAVSGTVTLAAGAYGHDRWKAGAGGCTYTFSTTANVTIITISAGTLQQVIEGSNLLSGTYTLNWTGTATARIDSGSYGSAPQTGTATGGTNQTVEFSTGTVSRVQYLPGSSTAVVPLRQIGQELALCQRYFMQYGIGDTFPAFAFATTNVVASVQFPVPMRIAPTLAFSNTGGIAVCGSTATATSTMANPAFTQYGGHFDNATSGQTVGQGGQFRLGTGSILTFTAEL